MKILTVTALLFAIALPATASVQPGSYSYSIDRVNQSALQEMTYTTEFSDGSALSLNISEYGQDSLTLASIPSNSDQCWVQGDYLCGVSAPDK